MRRYLWIIAAVLILDQVSKFAAMKYLTRHAEMKLLPFLNLTLTFNAGAAFGFLNNGSGWQNIFFVFVAIVAAIVIFTWLRRLGPGDHLTGIGLALILGGAIGNVIDRLIYGYVVDFIDVVFGSWHFWIFNVADSAISIGAVLLVLDTMGLGKYIFKQSS